MVMQEMSEAEYVVILKDIIAKIAFNRSSRKAYVFAKKESKEEMDQVEMADRKREIDVFTQKEDKEKAYVFAKKESKQSARDAQVNYVRRTGGKSVEDVERVDYVFSRKESKDLIEDNSVKGCEDARIWVKDEEKEIKDISQVGVTDHVKVDRLIKKIIVEAVKVEQLIVRESFIQVKKVFRRLEQSFADLEKADEEIFMGSEEKEVKDLLEAPREDCSTVGVQAGHNAHSKDEEAVKPDVVREAPEEEVLRVENIIEKIEKTPVKSKNVKSDLARVVKEKFNKVVEKKLDGTFNVEAVKVVVGKKDLGDVIANKRLTRADKEKLEESYVKIVKVKINEDKYVKAEKMLQDEGKDMVKQDTKSKHAKVKADKIDARYAGECVKVTDAKKAGTPAEDRENDEAGIDVSRAVRREADDAKHVRPVSESPVQVVEKVGAGVFAAESDVSRPAVGARLMYRQEYRDNRQAYSQSYEMNDGKGARDLKQPGRLEVVERGSPLKQLLTDVSQVEEPDGLTLVMDPVYTKRYKSDKHMYRKKCRVDSGQGAKVFEQPGRRDIAERDGPSQRSFTGVSGVEEPSKLGQQDMQLARTIYDENQAGMVQEESRYS